MSEATKQHKKSPIHFRHCVCNEGRQICVIHWDEKFKSKFKKLIDPRRILRSLRSYIKIAVAHSVEFENLFRDDQLVLEKMNFVKVHDPAVDNLERISPLEENKVQIPSVGAGEMEPE